MKALVTGGSGFLGRKVCALLLERGLEVHSISRRFHQDMDDQGIVQHTASITDKHELAKAIKGMQVVFHTAALAGIWGDKKNYEDINIHGTQNVIDLCKDENIQYLIYTSSPSVVFDGEDQEMVDESTPYPGSFLCDYSRTKAVAEKMVIESNHNNLKTVSLRPHLIWGVGDNHLIPRLLDRAESGKLKVIGDGKNKVDMVHIDNAAAAHLDAYDALISGTGAGKAYFITNDEPVAMWDWLNDLLTKLDKKVIEKKVPSNIAYGISTIFEFLYKIFRITKDPPLTRFVVRQFCTHHTYNIKNAQNDLNYKIRTTMEDGLKELLDHLKK